MAKEEITTGQAIRLENTGDSVEGKLVAVRDGSFLRPDGSRSKAYDIETNDGKRTVFGTTILERKMTEVKIGEHVTITYTGTIQSRMGRTVKDFKVYKGQ